MTKDLTVTIIQSDLLWHDAAANRDLFDAHIDTIDQTTDVIVLPEMFNTGFSMAPADVAEPMDGPTIQWMAAKAESTNAAICGSLAVEKGGHYYNRFVWMNPDGRHYHYDKKHLFTLAGEHKVYSPGNTLVTIHYKEWKILPQICYDLRFPEWGRNQPHLPKGNTSPVLYDILLYVANWPETRSYDWLTLLRARAIENQSYVVGVNRIGTDANDLVYNGDSCIIDPGWNKTLFHHEKTAIVLTQTLSKDHLDTVRMKLPFLKDREQQ